MPWGRRYKNFGQSGQFSFVTTSVLGRQPVFRNQIRAGIMAGSLINDCEFYGAPLLAFVVMPEHVHFVLGIPDGKNVSWLLNRIQSNAAKRILPRMTTEQKSFLESLPGATRRKLWMAGYRSITLQGRGYDVKIQYIHDNPCRRGLCRQQDEYLWSSARLYCKSLTKDFGFLRTDEEVIRLFCDPDLLRFKP